MNFKINIMKKLFLFSILVALFIAACEPAGSTAVTVSLSTSSFTAVGVPTSDTTVTIVVTNSTSQAATINWVRSEGQSVSGWTYMVNGGSAASGGRAIQQRDRAPLGFQRTHRQVPH